MAQEKDDIAASTVRSGKQHATNPQININNIFQGVASDMEIPPNSTGRAGAARSKSTIHFLPLFSCDEERASCQQQLAVGSQMGLPVPKVWQVRCGWSVSRPVFTPRGSIYLMIQACVGQSLRFASSLSEGFAKYDDYLKGSYLVALAFRALLCAVCFCACFVPFFLLCLVLCFVLCVVLRLVLPLCFVACLLCFFCVALCFALPLWHLSDSRPDYGRRCTYGHPWL